MAASRLVSAGRGSTSGSGRCPSAFRGPPLDAARRSTWEPRGSGSGLVAARTHVDTHVITIEIGSPQAVSATAASTCF